MAAKPRRPTVQAKRTPRQAWTLPTITPAMLRLATLLASLMVVIGGILGARAVLNNPENMPISQIDIQGKLEYIKDTDIRKIIDKYTHTNLYLLDAEALETELELQPWIRSVSLRKVWPAQLIVNVEEQHPVAFWGSDRLMNQYGDLFTAELSSMRGILPLLYSPENKGREMGERYIQVRDWLKGLSLEIAELTEDENGTWRIKIKDGPEVIVGNDDQQRRIQRFKVGVQKALANQLSKIRRVDLRYTNGFAVEWKQTPVSALSMVSSVRRS